jgi:hypothetical protein
MKIPSAPKEPIDPNIGQIMEFSESMHYIEKRGFRWDRFGDIFPFGPRIHSEGQWEKLVTAAVKSIRIPVDQELLLDLIDAQLCVYGERCDAINQKLCEDEYGDGPFVGEIEFSANMMQINSNIRSGLGLQSKDGRRAMLKLNTSIFNKICAEQLFRGVRE